MDRTGLEWTGWDDSLFPFYLVIVAAVQHS